MMLKSSNSIRIGDFAASSAVSDVERVNRRAFLRANPGEHNVSAFLAQRSQQIVKKSNAVRRFNLNQRADGMRLVVDCDPGRKFQLVQSAIMNLAPRLFE